jgi:chromosome segregation ATPase
MDMGMNKFFNPLTTSVLLLVSLLPLTVSAAPRAADGNSKALAKLQAMVKEANTERDLLKTEKDKLATEVEALKKENASKASDEERVSGELAAQKSSNAAVSNTLEQTHAKLLEVIEKYNALNKSKNELNAIHVDLESSHKQKETELQSCESKNIKLYEAAEEILTAYDNYGIFNSLLESEPIFQIKSVEMEGVVQEYEDKLRKQQYQAKEASTINKTVEVAK